MQPLRMEGNLNGQKQTWLLEVACVVCKSKKIISTIMASFGVKRSPTASSVIAENLDVDVSVVCTVLNLLDKDNTVPFIARYRKEKTGGLDPTVLRNIQTQYEQLK